MSLPLVKVPDHDVQFNFDEIAKRIVDTGGRQIKLRFGTGACTWTASVTSAGTSITHGMGSTPIAVVVSPGSWTTATFPVYRVDTLGATTFAVTGRDAANVARTGSDSFYWIAIG